MQIKSVIGIPSKSSASLRIPIFLYIHSHLCTVLLPLETIILRFYPTLCQFYTNLKKNLLEHPRKLLFPVKNLNFGIMETFHQLTTGVAPFQGKRNQAAFGPHWRDNKIQLFLKILHFLERQTN